MINGGYNYAEATQELRGLMTDTVIAKAIGYRHRNSVLKMVQGAIPSHPIGENLYILYVETFKRKPPCW